MTRIQQGKLEEDTMEEGQNIQTDSSSTSRYMDRVASCDLFYDGSSPPLMDTQTYPGKGLSPSQLVFALNEELKRAVCSPSYVTYCDPTHEPHPDIPYSLTWDEVSELNRDASAALATIREWMTSFAPINRVPMDVLSMIPTHLPSQGDRFRASFVCRHWRRTFLRHAALWSHLILSKGGVYVKTLLERARGSPLTIVATRMDPADVAILLLPHTNRITSIELANSQWEDIQRFSEMDSGPLPHLRTLNINVVQEIDWEDPEEEEVTLPSRPLFSGAVDLKEFRLHSDGSPFLNYFVFPNLTSFELSVAPAEEQEFHGSQLLDFLEASPMLQVVHIKTAEGLSLEDVPEKRLVVLHNVENLGLVTSHDDPIYDLVAHMSCPSVKSTSLTTIGKKNPDFVILAEAFSGSVSWDPIIRQYTRSPIEEITVEIKVGINDSIACSITLLSPDATVIRLHFEVSGDDDDYDDEDQDTSEWWSSFSQIYQNIFFDISETIQHLPSLANVRNFRVYDLLVKTQPTDIANELGELLRSLGPLEELTFCRCDMRSFPSHRYSGTRKLKKPIAYPLIKVLTISDPLGMFNQDVVGGLVKFAKAQHQSGVPFERVTIRMNDPPAEMEEKLKSWVGVVECFGAV